MLVQNDLNFWNNMGYLVYGFGTDGIYYKPAFAWRCYNFSSDHAMVKNKRRGVDADNNRCHCFIHRNYIFYSGIVWNGR